MNNMLSSGAPDFELRLPGQPSAPEKGFSLRRPGRRVLSLLTAAALLLLSPAAPSGSSAEESAAVPAAEETKTGSPAPAKGYVLVTTATQTGFLPLPEEEDYVFPLTQTLPDGTVAENLIHVTPDGVYMESSNCENQDCVHEGTVTLENRQDRILGNWIICLPHQLTLQLLTPEEVLAMMSAPSPGQNP